MYRHAAEGYHTVDVRVNGYDLVRLVESGDQELITKLLCRVTLHISLVCTVTNIHKNLLCLALRQVFCVHIKHL